MWIRLGALAVIAGSSLFGQPPGDAPAATEPTIRLDVRQVLVPVIVTDKKGRPVTGLGAADFQIYEDGVAQQVVAFTRETAALVSPAAQPKQASPDAQAPVASSASIARPPQRIWIVCFDVLHTSFGNFARARANIEKFFDKGHENGDQFVLVTLGRDLRIVQPATSNVAAVRARLESSDFTNSFGASGTAEFESEINEIKRKMDVYCTRCPCGRSASNQKDTCELEQERLRQELDARAERLQVIGNAFLDGLKRVVDELAKIDGHRNLLLVSDGFSLSPGSELYAIASAYVPNTFNFKSDPSRDLQPKLEASLKTAAARDITVSTIETRGVYSPSFSPGGMSDASSAGPGATGRQEMLGGRTTASLTRGGTILEDVDSKWSSVAYQNGSVLAQLAASTGGIYFHNNNDLLKGFRDTLTDPRDDYVLAYVPVNTATDGKFRHITVELKDKSLFVRSKSGYWGASPQ